MTTHILQIDGEHGKACCQPVYKTLCGRMVTKLYLSNDNERVTCLACQKSNRFKPELMIDIDSEEISIIIDTDYYLEVVKWVQDEWIEDPSVVGSIAHAIDLAHHAPYLLMATHIEHIQSQFAIKEK
jgi:hypothetical protein